MSKATSAPKRTVLFLKVGTVPVVGVGVVVGVTATVVDVGEVVTVGAGSVVGVGEDVVGPMKVVVVLESVQVPER